jgi:hypothetical protein
VRPWLKDSGAGEKTRRYFRTGSQDEPDCEEPHPVNPVDPVKNGGRETGGRRFDGGFDEVGLIHHEEHEVHEEGFL